MPIYEFRCQECNHVFDELCRFDEEGDKQCPRCGQGGARRLISVFAAHGLENGHHGVGKNWGGGGGSNGKSESKPDSGSSDSGSGGCCGSSCGCAN